MTEKQRVMLALIFVVIATLVGFGISPYLDKVASEKAALERGIYMDGFSTGMSNGVDSGMDLGANGYHRCLRDFKGIYFCNESTLRVMDANYTTIWAPSINTTVYVTPGRNVIMTHNGSSYLTAVK
jgi:hypothetical protein